MISKGREIDFLASEIGNVCCEDGGVGMNISGWVVLLEMLFEKSEEDEWVTSKGWETDLLGYETCNIFCEDGGGVETNKSDWTYCNFL